MAASLDAVSKPKSGFRVYAIVMIRNDSDIIHPFLAQADELFDKLLIVDAQSTEGTKEAIVSVATRNEKINLYSLDRQEKYQSAIMNRLARSAFDEGADWIFLLDADEFINIDSRQSLQKYLASFPDELMYLPWINLVPSQYGNFTSFDIAQSYFWSGRTSPYRKVALSKLFIANNPSFYIHEGNHYVSPNFTSAPFAKARDGLTLLHLPVRSADRFKYKMTSARKALLSKHNRLPGEGTHVEAICDLISTHILDGTGLSSIAANYGENSDQDPHIDPVEEGWPNIQLPEYVLKIRKDAAPNVTLSSTLLKDKQVKWRQSDFIPGSAVCAVIEGRNISIRPQPISGDGNLFQGQFAAYPKKNINMAPAISSNLIIEAINASFTKIKLLTVSAWTDLVPALFCIFSIVRPRRFVELGTHSGMCFFAACQATEFLSLNTQCIAVDNWIGDEHAGFHAIDVFEKFCADLKQNFPDQMYIKANFKQAVECFENGSIDLLHIDGFHTYATVRADFETWLPKMSQNGVMLFHDVNVHERGFGVWRLWRELQERYPSFSIWHCHGLGIVYVGREPSVLVDIFASLQKSDDYKQIVRSFLERVGSLSIENRRGAEEISRRDDEIRKRDYEIGRRDDELRKRDDEISRRDDSRKKLEATLELSILEPWRQRGGYSQAGSGLRGLLLYWQRKQDIRIISESKLFDAEYYLATYPDIRNADVDPIVHFANWGVHELRNPSALFNTRRYLLNNVDVLWSGMNPLVHYIRFGRKENRSW